MVFPENKKKATSFIYRLVSLCFDRFGMTTMVQNNEKSTGSISCQSLHFLYVYRYIWRYPSLQIEQNFMLLGLLAASTLDEKRTKLFELIK